MSLYFVTEAFAMAPPQGAAGASPSGTEMLMQFFPLILMFVIFWFLLIRPQQKRAKQHKQMLSELKKGDYVITGAGLLGRIIALDEETVTIECGDAQLRMTRASIGNKVNKDGTAVAPAPAPKKTRAKAKAEPKAEPKPEPKPEPKAEPEEKAEAEPVSEEKK